MDEAPDTGINWRRRLFLVSAWGLAGSLYFLSPAVLVFLGWFQEPFSELGNAEAVSHRVHEVLFGNLFAAALVGTVSQIRSHPQISGALQTLVVVGTFFATLASLGRIEGLGFLFLGLALSLVLSHPLRRTDLTFHPHLNSILLALSGIVPLAVLAADHLGKARLEAADHVTHWAGVAAWAIALALLAVLAAMRPGGYRLIEVTVGFAGLSYGAVSLAFPFDASAGGIGLWLMAWSAVWIVRGFTARGLSKRAWPLRVAAGFGLFFLTTTGLAFGLDSGSVNVPHGIDGVPFAAIERATCIECHASGREGATLVPHELTRVCEEHCWGGRIDCVGCHRYDPALGGPDQIFEVPTAAALPRGARQLLTTAQVSSLSRGSYG